MTALHTLVIAQIFNLSEWVEMFLFGFQYCFKRFSNRADRR